MGSRKLAPIALLLTLVASLTVAGYFTQDFALDASSDTLIDQNDPQLQYFQATRERFGGDEEFLILTYSPNDADIFFRSALEEIANLQSQLEAVSGVSSVYSILDAPLLKSPPISLAQLEQGFLTLRSTDVDLALAKIELTGSAFFADLLVSKDAETTAFRISMEQDQNFLAARKQRDQLRTTAATGVDNDVLLAAAEQQYRDRRDKFLLDRSKVLADIGIVKKEFSANAVLHLGGMPSIANDIIEYVRQDLVVFSSSILLLVMFMLYWFFRKIRFVFIPIAASATSIVLTIGLLGFLHQNVTIVSSNFVSILVISTISFCIHLIVKYRELRVESPDAAQHLLVTNCMRFKLAPCIFTALSTIAAFGSLLTSGILPVRDFGWIICIGVVISFLSAYGMFACVMLLLPKGQASSTLESRPILAHAFCKVSTEYAKFTVLGACLLLVPVSLGISRLSLDNSFIDYFKENTEIHQGLKYIDINLGGTIPFDVILKFPPYEAEEAAESFFDSDDFEDDFFDDDEAQDLFPEKYWYTTDKIDLVRKLHDYIDSLDRTGKVLSVSSLERVAREFNEGQPLNALQLVGALAAIPVDVRKELIDPYAAPEAGEMRITIRIKEYGEAFSRDELLTDIREFAEQELSIDPENIQLTGMMVMFNNMLKELFDSQQSSIVFVVGMTFVMFLILLRSVRLAIFGLLPNILAAGVILSFMGLAGIPLDLMTITIAALVIGIGVDDATHYLHRFRIEFMETGSVIESVQRCHASTGHALYFTSFTVVAGFSVLAFSNFVPTINFGLLTSLAMIIALVANLALLPGLLVCFHPDGEPRD